MEDKKMAILHDGYIEDAVTHANNRNLAKEEIKAKANKTKRAKRGTPQLAKAIQDNSVTNVRDNNHNRNITPIVREFISKELTGYDADGRSYIQNYVTNFLATARDKPGSVERQMLGRILFNDNLLQQLDQGKDDNKDIEFMTYRLRKTLFDKQQEVFDNERDKFISIICGRRSGKTELSARELIKVALKPKHHVLYINRNFDAAIRQMWKPVIQLLDDFGIKYVPSKGTGTITLLDSQSVITFLGNNNSADNDKSRGEKYALIIVDEQGHQRHLRYLIDEVLQPATVDYADSQIILLGTPPRTKKHYSYIQWHNDKIKHYKWTLFDNPFIPNKDNILETIADQHGVSVDDAFIRREYLGDTEAGDDDARTIKSYSYKDIPKDVTFDRAYIGVDFGYTDAAAVVATLSYKKTLYVLKSDIQPGLAASELCEKVVEMQKYLAGNFRLAREPVVITDTNEKAIVKDLRVTYHLKNVLLAYKYDKRFALEQLNDWLATQAIALDKEQTKALQEEFANTLWKRDEDTDEIIHEIDDDAFHPNGLFALLYITRQWAVEEWGRIERNKVAKPIEVGGTTMIEDEIPIEDDEMVWNDEL